MDVDRLIQVFNPTSPAAEAQTAPPVPGGVNDDPIPSFFEIAARDAVSAGYLSQEGFERVLAALERSRE